MKILIKKGEAKRFMLQKEESQSEHGIMVSCQMSCENYTQELQIFKPNYSFLIIIWTEGEYNHLFHFNAMTVCSHVYVCVGGCMWTHARTHTHA